MNLLAAKPKRIRASKLMNSDLSHFAKHKNFKHFSDTIPPFADLLFLLGVFRSHITYGGKFAWHNPSSCEKSQKRGAIVDCLKFAVRPFYGPFCHYNPEFS